MRKVLGVFLFALLFFAGCGDDGPSEPEIPSLTGSWIGSFESANIVLTLVERDQAVTGSGNIASGTTGVALAVQGSHAHPNFSLILRASGYEDFNFSGRFRDEYSIRGSLTGSGFNGQSIDLVRQ